MPRAAAFDQAAVVQRRRQVPGQGLQERRSSSETGPIGSGGHAPPDSRGSRSPDRSGTTITSQASRAANAAACAGHRSDPLDARADPFVDAATRSGSSSVRGAAPPPAPSGPTARVVGAVYRGVQVQHHDLGVQLVADLLDEVRPRPKSEPTTVTPRPNAYIRVRSVCWRRNFE